MQDVAAFGALCRARGVPPCTSMRRRAPASCRSTCARCGIDLLSFTAHKLYGPKGIGALYVQPRAASALQPLMFGGGQERGLRSGTLPTHQIVGFGAACELAAQSMAAEAARHAATARARCGRGCGDLPRRAC